MEDNGQSAVDNIVKYNKDIIAIRKSIRELQGELHEIHRRIHHEQEYFETHEIKRRQSEIAMLREELAIAETERDTAVLMNKEQGKQQKLDFLQAKLSERNRLISELQQKLREYEK